MARNVEIKARIEDIDSVLRAAAGLADGGPTEMTQDDIFFACKKGRLKLRVLSPDEGQLIFYRRADQRGPKESFYIVSPTASPDTLRQSLSLAYGEIGRVHKNRILFLAGRTRIHIDRVEGLGDFLELEVVLEESENVDLGEAIARDLMQELQVQPDQLIGGAYIDLLLADGRSPNHRDA
jgi:predicted adenylyl cyclase CyaB